MTNSEPGPGATETSTGHAVGADLSDALDALDGIESLHDRVIPGTRAWIDHIVVGPSGVYVIDTNDAPELVVRRDRRLFVGAQDRSDLLAAMKVPVDAVTAALGDLHLPVSRALCFVGGVWPPDSPPFMLRGVWVGTPNPLCRLIAQPGQLLPRDIASATRLLDELLPATD